MPIDEYFQEYGPIQRRRVSGVLYEEAPVSRVAQSQQPADEHVPPPIQPDIPLPARPHRRVRRRRIRRPFPVKGVLVGTVVLCLAVVLAMPYVLPLRYREQALPNVTVQGVSVAGTDQTVISETLSEHYADFLRQPLTLTYKDQTWRPTLSQLGVTFDLNQAAARALAAGRRGNLLIRWQEQWQLWQGGIDVAPRLSVDKQRLQTYLASLLTPLEYSPRDAALSVAEGNIIGTPAQPGLQVLIDDSANDILLALRTLTPQEVLLRTRLLEPTIGDTALQMAEEQASTLLKTPLVLAHGERNWTWHPDKLAELVRVESDGTHMRVRIDPESVVAAVEGLAQVVDSGIVEPHLRFENNNLVMVEEGRIGWKLDQAATTQMISNTLALNNPNERTIELPVEDLYPQVTAENMHELGIRELVAEGQSSFAGSAQYRITNIKAGAIHTDGVLIAPDEEFSFNTQIGEINAENGFVEGYAVIGNRTQLEWGGGVCQNSTTVFRAAFWAGLPITERYAHPFYISWYDRFAFGPYGDGAGLDATIYTGVNDLKFVNTTGNWLLMQTYVDEINQILTVQFYGTKPGYDVVLDGPYVTDVVDAPGEPVYIDDPGLPAGQVYQSDIARSGRDIVVHRIIVENGVEVSRDSFFTRFKAWPNVFVRGTG